MKILRFFIFILITLILGMVVLLGLAIKSTNYNVEDSMVFIETIGEDTIKNGMGVVYKTDDKHNYIITNYHVINDYQYIYVYNLENKRETAELVGYDIYTDLAILKIDDDLKLKSVILAEENVKQNEEVCYFDMETYSINVSTVLSLNNEVCINKKYGNSCYDAGMFSANIVEGNSGGPLFDQNKKLVGIISLKDEDSNNAFYIPMVDVMNIVSKLENNNLKRPNLGAIFASSNNLDVLNNYGITVNNINGVVIVELVDDYPLELSGFIKGDVITKVNDVAIIDVLDLQKEIYSHFIGDTVIVEYYRNNKLNSVTVSLNK